MTVLWASGRLLLVPECRLVYKQWQRFHDFVCRNFKHQRQRLFRSCQSCDCETWCSCVCHGWCELRRGLCEFHPSTSRSTISERHGGEVLWRRTHAEWLGHSDWTCRCPGPQGQQSPFHQRIRFWSMVVKDQASGAIVGDWNMGWNSQTSQGRPNWALGGNLGWTWLNAIPYRAHLPSKHVLAFFKALSALCWFFVNVSVWSCFRSARRSVYSQSALDIFRYPVFKTQQIWLRVLAERPIFTTFLSGVGHHVTRRCEPILTMQFRRNTFHQTAHLREQRFWNRAKIRGFLQKKWIYPWWSWK